MGDSSNSIVQLAVYDLSRGMARALSRQILGQQLDGVWHTGIVVFGKEYYFGGGVQKMNWGQFAQMNQLPPTELLELGRTTKTQAEFENYLRTIQHRFTTATYDLIHNNCNNFSNEIALYLLGRGIPDHIINLPRIVFSSPGGAMLRPMIEGIQNNIRQQQGFGLDPFSHHPATNEPNNAFESALSSSVTAVALNALQNAAVNPVSLNMAELEEHPLISADASTVVAVGSKILNLPDQEGVKGNGLQEEEKQRLQLILARLSQPSSSSSSSSPPFSIEDYTFMERLLAAHPAVHMPCLFIVRLMFLQDNASDYKQLTIVREIIRRLLSPINQQGDSNSVESTNPFASIPAHVMALCALSNLLSHDRGKEYLLGDNSSIYSDEVKETPHEQRQQDHFINELVDVALHGLQQARPEVRQMSITLAYNLTLACSKDHQGPWSVDSEGVLDPHALQLLCGCFEGIAEEKDGIVRKRRLAVICRIMRVFKSSAPVLVKDLGFDEVLKVMKSDALKLSPPLTAEERVILDELLFYLREVK